MIKRFAVLFVALFTLAGCTDMKIEDFSSGTPAFDPFDYFAGETRAWGVFEDRFGTVRRQFEVDITGTVENGTLTLDESFRYADGETDRRVWRIRRNGNGGFIGTADDVIGEATGEAAGNALHWEYDMDLAVGDDTWRVRFDDWMFLQEDGVLINRARVTKWGVEIGEVSLFFKSVQGAGE